MFAHLVRALRARGARVVSYIRATGEGWLGKEIDRAGSIVVPFTIDRPFSPAFASWLAQSFRQHDIDAAHSHEFAFAIYGAWAARLAGVGHVITMHGGRYYAKRATRRVAMRVASESSHRLVGVSETVQRHLAADLRMSPSRISVIENGIPAPEIVQSTIRQELGLDADHCLVLAVGNLYPVKGHDVLLRALALLPAAVHVAIAGRGDEEPSLRALAASLRVEHRVHFLGLRGDVGNLLAGCDIFCQPSRSEGLPLAVLEAMFAGRAIVTSHVGGMPDALGHGEAGLTVAPEDPAALAAALVRLASDAQERARLGGRGEARANERFTVDGMTSRYVELYRAACRRRS